MNEQDKNKDVSAGIDRITVNGVAYVREAQALIGKRAVVVVDRGWIFAGDVEDRDGRIRITRAVWPMRWESIGFDGVIANPKDARVKLRQLSSAVDLPADAEVFRVPVEATWGLP